MFAFFSHNYEDEEEQTYKENNNDKLSHVETILQSLEEKQIALTKKQMLGNP